MLDTESRYCNCLPLGNPEFSDIQDEQMIYVDKTGLIYKIAVRRVPMFLSRPRRFGKSLLINTLASLFGSVIKKFRGLDIEKKWTDKTYKVIKIDFSRLASNDPETFKCELSATITREFGLVGSISASDALGVRDPDSILDEIAKDLANNSTVLLIDEYDAPLTHDINNPVALNEIISILNGFYATAKQYT